MNLFNYLMANKGHNTSVRDDLFAYLLGKRTPKEVKTATGTTISITDATREKIVSLTLSKESTQDGTPSPENPVEVKTVKGYRNLFDKDNASYKNGYIKNNTGNETSSDLSGYLLTYIPVEPNKEYTIQGSLISSNGCRIYFYDNNKNWISRTNVILNIPVSFETPNNCYYIQFQYTQSVYNENSVQINEGNIAFPYVPYGTNWIYTAVSNGTDTNYYTIPLNNNEIAGIGEYKDELIVDKNGHCWLNKKTGKVILDGSNDENWTKEVLAVGNNYYIPISNPLKGQYYKIFNNIGKYTGQLSANYNTYISSSGNLNYVCTEITSVADFKTMLSNQNMIIYYALATPQLIDLNYTVDLTLFEGINNISNSEDMDMTLKYY